MQSLFEKLHLKDEKCILIQGLPSSIEKQFAKLSYSKNVTPLLRIKKIDFALIFAINRNQMCRILEDVLPALHNNSKLWVAYPKAASKIASDLNRDCNWDVLSDGGYESDHQIIIDHVWTAIHFKKLPLSYNQTIFSKIVNQKYEDEIVSSSNYLSDKTRSIRRKAHLKSKAVI